VTFWGTRGSISTPGQATERYGGNTPCVSVHYKDTRIILDAGTGIRNAGLYFAEEAAKGKKPLDLHLMLSHTHWDHIQGLPFFAPAYTSGARISIYGSPRKETFLESILRGQMDVNYFPVDMGAFAADLSIIEFADQTVRAGDMVVQWEEQECHPGGSVRYRITAGDSSVVYATDVEMDMIAGTPSKDAENASAINAYCDFIEGADLLIADGQYTTEEYETKQGWGHTSVPVLLDVVRRRPVAQLAVFHHDPSHSDDDLDAMADNMAASCADLTPSMRVFWAREGMTIRL